MAVFRVPRITTIQRTPLLLDEGEIVFDTDLKKFFGGDGTTLGGNELCYCSGAPSFDDTILTESGEGLTTEDGFYLEFEIPTPSSMVTELGDTLTTESLYIIEV